MSDEKNAALYFVTDKRTDGRVRIVAEYRDPRDALEHAKLMRWAGAPAQILIASEYEPDA